MKYPTVAPSVLSLDFSRLEEELERMREAGVELLHYDVMDGHFTPWISFGEHLFKFFKGRGLRTDVHLMVLNPLPHLKNFLDLGADQVTVHLEALEDPQGFLKKIESYREGKIIGVAINPETPIDEKALNSIRGFDKVMVMSVHPGRSGQSFIQGSQGRIRAIREFSERENLNLLIEVDGGINNLTGPSCLEAGADILVSGNYLCKAIEPRKAIEQILGKTE